MIKEFLKNQIENFSSILIYFLFSIIFVLSFTQCIQPDNIIHDKIVNTSISSNKRYKAEIKTDKTHNYYFLTVYNMEKDSFIAFDSLICMKGYHEPVFNLTWNEKQSLLELTLDNDF